MGNSTLTTAGLQRLAGGARPCAGSRYRTASPLAAASAAPAVQGTTRNLSSKWAVDAIAEPTATFMVFDGKHRPTRQPSELSP